MSYRWKPSRSKLAHVVAIAALGLVGTCLTFAQQPQPAQEQDFGTQLPRVAAKSPQESLGEFELVDGFEMQTVAAEPLLTDPVAIDFDETGRAYVVCMRGYSEQDQQQLGEVRLLEDTNGDGQFDRSSVFASGLSWPTAVVCFDGGVFIGAAPDILYCRDDDGNGIADTRTTVFRGFSKDNVQGLLNSFRWGLDNRIHVAVSTSGASMRRLAASLHGEQLSETEAAKQDAIILRGRDFSFDPRTLEIEIESGGGQHGMSFDDWGRKYVTSNSNHIQQVVIEDRYLRRNPLLPPTNPTAMIAADGPQAEVFRISPVEPWRVLRTRLRVAGEVPGPIEGGGRAAGYFTGATGVTIYRGDAWPAEMQGLAFIGDVGSNIVHRKSISSTYENASHVQRLAKRIDEHREFLASHEIWFRPVQFANAPDGTLWVLDMYREVIEHPKSLPESIKRHLDLTSGQDRGRIYRIAPAGFEASPIPNLSVATSAELAGYLEHRNAWHRETAARLLFERQDKSVVTVLQELIRDDGAPLGQLHALWALAGLQSLDWASLHAALHSQQAEVRCNALRLCEPLLHGEDIALRDEVLKSLLPMAGDADIEVRFQLALTLGEVADATLRSTTLMAILQHDANDPWVRLAVLTSIGGLAGDAFVALAGDDAFAQTPAGNELLAALADQVAADQDALPKVLAWLNDAWPDQPDAVVRYCLRLLPELGASPAQVRDSLLSTRDGTALYNQLVGAAGAVTSGADDIERNSAAWEDRQSARHRAAQILWLAPWNDVAAAYEQLLAPQTAPQTRAAAITSLGRIDAPAAAKLMLNVWPLLTPELRTIAEGAIFARPTSTQLLLDAVQANELARADISQELIRRLSIHPDFAIKSRAARLFGASSPSAREDVIAAYRSALELAGNAQSGRKVFEQNCAKCHMRAGIGHEIGPALADTSAKTREQLMIAVLDPNREVNPAYLNYVAETEDGRVLTGIIAAESAAGITLKREEGQTQTVRRDELSDLSSSGQSIMPEGLEKEIDRQQFADLLQFLTTEQ